MMQLLYCCVFIDTTFFLFSYVLQGLCPGLEVCDVSFSENILMIFAPLDQTFLSLGRRVDPLIKWIK
jgi:hypothetical protein